MNILDLLFEPYVIIILISIFITVITYFVVKNDNTENNDDNDDETSNKTTDVSKTLLYTFIGSLVILTLSKFAFVYMNNNNYFQKGGSDINEKLTIVADDVDIGLYED